MAGPINYNLLNRDGVDVTVVYTVNASTTPETPAPPFQPGDVVLGTYGSEYVFVQASTSITFYDFIAITGVNQANSLTDTNGGMAATGGVRLGLAPAATQASGQANGNIKAGTYFWAQINGGNAIGNTSTTATAGLQLYTSATAGVVKTVSATTHYGIGGVALQLTTTITGTQANTQLAYFTMSWPRIVNIIDTAGVPISAGYAAGIFPDNP